MTDPYTNASLRTYFGVEPSDWHLSYLSFPSGNTSFTVYQIMAKHIGNATKVVCIYSFFVKLEVPLNVCLCFIGFGILDFVVGKLPGSAGYIWIWW